MENKKKGRAGWIVAGILLIMLLALLALVGRQLLHYELKNERAERWAEQESAGLSNDSSYTNPDTQNVAKNDPADTIGAAEVETRNINRVNIDWVSGSVTVKPYDGETISISETEGTEPLYWRQEGENLTIRFAKSDFFHDLKSKELTVLIPRDLAQSLRYLRISTVSADVIVSGLETVNLEFDSTSGSLTADGLYRKLEVDTTSGMLTFRGQTQEAELETISGDFKLELEETPRELSFDSTSGNAAIYLPEGSRFALEFESVSGSLNNEFGIMRGEAAEMELETISGDVQVLKAG